MSLKEHKLVDLEQLSVFRGLMDQANGIWTGTSQQYQEQKSTITSRFVAILDDGVPITFVASAIPDEQELDDIVFSSGSQSSDPSGNEVTDGELDDMLGGK